MTLQVVQGTFTGIAAGAALPVSLPQKNYDTTLVNGSAVNCSVAGTFAGTVQVERQFSDDPTWYPLSRDATGAPAAFTAPTSVALTETEGGVSYRLRCTAFTSGTINWRISQ